MSLTVQEALALLELEEGAGLVDIKKAYKQLALKWHPDKAGASSGCSPSDRQQHFVDVSAAYTLLTAQHSLYSELLEEALTQDLGPFHALFVYQHAHGISGAANTSHLQTLQNWAEELSKGRATIERLWEIFQDSKASSSGGGDASAPQWCSVFSSLWHTEGPDCCEVQEPQASTGHTQSVDQLMDGCEDGSNAGDGPAICKACIERGSACVDGLVTAESPVQPSIKCRHTLLFYWKWAKRIVIIKILASLFG